jgi:hypothetical protein
MACSAIPQILRTEFCNDGAVKFFVTVTKQRRLLFPLLTMTNRSSNQSMRDLMQQNLMHLVQICSCHKVLTQGDSLLRVVTLPGSSDCTIETKRIINQPMGLK